MSRKLQIGIIGSGGIAQSCHIPGYQSMPDLCEVKWVCDASATTAAEAAEKFDIPCKTTDYREVLDDAEVDAVSIATPNKHHLRPALNSLSAGKHVLCEKPLAMNGDEAKQIVLAARASGKVFQVALQFRFGGPAQFVKDYIDKGHMGDIYYARAHALRRRGVPHWGVFIDKEQQGGGPLIDIGVHILDTTLFFMGHPKPTVVSAQTWNHLGTNPDITNPWGEYDRSKFTVEDFAAGLIRFENGAAITLESSFMGNMEGDAFQTQLFGTKSGAIVKGWGEDSVRLFTEHDKQIFDMVPANVPNIVSSHTEEVKAFVDAILNGKPSPVPAEQGFVLNAIFDAMYESAETGHEVRVNLDL
jgi:predicted dehydrogenase